MMKIDSNYLFLLENLGLAQIERSLDVTFVIDGDFILRAFNPAWESFARENNGESVLDKYRLGSLVTDAFPAALKPYYIDLYRKALSSGKRIDFEYECSSDTIFRKFMQSLYPLRQRAGILVSNHLEIELPRADEAVPFSPKHRNNHGMIVQCSHCRRIKDQTILDKWDWIPEFVRKIPASISHGLCHRCAEFYYPGFSGQEEKPDEN